MIRLFKSRLLPAGLALLAACSWVNPHYNPERAHHRPDGFVNPDASLRQPGDHPTLTILWRHLRGDFRPERPPEGGYEAFARAWSVKPDPVQLAQRQQAPVLTWLGHASLLLQVNGYNLLIDPVFSESVGPTSWLGRRREVPAPLTIDALPPIDIVLISHSHYDHLDLPSLQALRSQGQRPRILVPLGLKRWLAEEGIDPPVSEMDWWETWSDAALPGLSIHFVPAQHWSKRTPFDTNRTLWGGFVVETRPANQPSPWRFLYTGDTGYSALFKEIRRRLGAMDYVAVPVGAYQPREFMRPQHTDPDDAVQIVLDLEARQAMGLHWGTFPLSREAFDQPPVDLALALKKRGLPADRLRLFKHGERRALD